MPLEEAEAARLGADRETSCLPRVRSVETSNSPEGPRRTARIAYCDRDPHNGNGPYVLTIGGEAGAYWLKAPEGEGRLAFKSLGDAHYLTGTNDAAFPTVNDYTISVFNGDDIEVFALGCDDFPSVKRANDGGMARCEIDSLDRIAPELAKVVTAIAARTKVPLLILRRVGNE